MPGLPRMPIFVLSPISEDSGPAILSKKSCGRVRMQSFNSRCSASMGPAYNSLKIHNVSKWKYLFCQMGFLLFVGILNFHQKCLPVYLLWAVLLSSSPQFLQQWRWEGFCSNCTAGKAALLKHCWKMKIKFSFYSCLALVMFLVILLSYINFYPAVKYAIILILTSYGCFPFYYVL